MEVLQTHCKKTKDTTNCQHSTYKHCKAGKNECDKQETGQLINNISTP